MSKLTINSTGFINKVTKLDSGKIALELTLNSYSTKKPNSDDFETKRIYVTAYTTDEKRVPENYEKKPFSFELSGLIANPVAKNGKAYANLSCSFDSATLIEKKQANAC